MDEADAEQAVSETEPKGGEIRRLRDDIERRLGIEPQRCESLLQGEPATIATRSRSSEPGNRGKMKW